MIRNCIDYLQPIPEERLTRAQEAIEMFLNGWMTNAFGPQGMTYKFHSLVHMLDDCRNHGCHLEFLAAYIYENFHMQWGSFIRSGNLPVSQIRYRFHKNEKNNNSNISLTHISLTVCFTNIITNSSLIRIVLRIQVLLLVCSLKLEIPPNTVLVH